MLKGFKDFISQGNVIDLAVAVIIGGAFTPIVTAVTKVILDTIGAVVGSPNFDSVLQYHINGSDAIQPGTILTALINFLIIAAAIYFVIVMPMNKLAERRKKGIEPELEAPSEDVLLLTEIRDLLARRPGV